MPSHGAGPDQAILLLVTSLKPPLDSRAPLLGAWLWLPWQAQPCFAFMAGSVERPGLPGAQLELPHDPCPQPAGRQSRCVGLSGCRESQRYFLQC